MLLSIQVNFRTGSSTHIPYTNSLARKLLGGCWFVLAALLSAMSAEAQDDPFGAASATPPPAARPASSGNLVELPKETNVVVLSIRDSKLETPQQYGQAFVWLARIQRFDEIGRYLDQIKAANWDEARKAQLLDNTDSALWLNIANRPELSIDQKMVAREVLDAAYQQARSPQQLDQWIVALSSESASERAKARNELLKVDFEGLQRLAKAIATDEVSNVDGLSAAVLGFDERGISMLEDMIAGSDLATAERATRILAKIGPFDSASALLIASNRQDSTEGMKKAALEGLNRLLGYIPNENEAFQYMRNKIARLTQEAQAYEGNRYDRRWAVRWDHTKSLLTGKQVSIDKAFWWQADREARGVLRWNEVPADTLESLVAIRMQNAFEDNGAYQDDVALEQLMSELPENVLTPEFLGRVLRISRDRGWNGSQVRALQLLGAAQFLDSTRVAGMPEWIVQDIAASTGSGNPGIRYAAFETIAALDPQAPYAGSHRVLLAAIELLRVGPYPRALVVSGFSYETGDAAKKLRQYGYQSSAMGSARATLRDLDHPNPYELIVVAGKVSDMPVSQLVQRITESRYGKGIPVVVVLGENEPARRALAGTKNVIIVDAIPTDALAMQGLWEQIAPVAVPKLSPNDRISAAVRAGEFLKRLASQPELYSFYNLGSMEEEIEADLALPAGWVAGDSLLASFGSAEGQAKLSNRIVDMNSDLDSRRRAAVQLVHSIRRHGVRMDRETVQLQYDRFNRLIATRPDDAAPIGWILDAMEARAGMREWPELPQLVAAPAEKGS
jgi:hypothetical protein